MPKTATVKNTMPPRPTAPIASGANQPTMIVSTTPMNIQPSSAMMTGQASRIVGTSACHTSRWRIAAGMILLG